MNKRLHPLPSIAGRRIIISESMVDIKQIRFPKIRRYKPLRKFKLFRILRTMFLKWLRLKYKKNHDNFICVPSKKIIKLDDSLYMHPAVYNELKNKEPFL